MVGNTWLCAVLLVGLPGCSDKTDAEFRVELAGELHDAIDVQLAAVVAAAHHLQAVAPSRAWTDDDTAALAAMQDAWRRMRGAYERIEGPIDGERGELEARIDGGYDRYLARLGPGGDRDPFDASGVIGMHAVERILYAPVLRDRVLAFERSLPGYRAPAYPATDGEAVAFKTQLVGRLIDDTAALREAWHDTPVDPAAAYLGLIRLMHDQAAKIDAAVDGADESRYANATLFDLRNNLAGTRQTYELFRAWIRSKSGGARIDDAIVRAFAGMAVLYDRDPGDALPAPPQGWAGDQPSDDDLTTPFGELWANVRGSVDPETGSMTLDMQRVPTLLGLTGPGDR